MVVVSDGSTGAPTPPSRVRTTKAVMATTATIALGPPMGDTVYGLAVQMMAMGPGGPEHGPEHMPMRGEPGAATYASFARALQSAFRSRFDEMGDKVSSRRAALRGGAPIVPGTTARPSSPRTQNFVAARPARSTRSVQTTS